MEKLSVTFGNGNREVAMSRIGLKPIDLPQGVEVSIKEGNLVEVKGPKGSLVQQLPKEMNITIEGNVVSVARNNETKKQKSLHGLTRSLLSNMVEGVSQGFSKSLVIEGTGYKASKSGKKLVLNLGHSHPIEVEDPEGIVVEVPDVHKIIVNGIDKQLVGSHAALIRDFRRPEPYKEKDIK